MLVGYFFDIKVIITNEWIPEGQTLNSICVRVKSKSGRIVETGDEIRKCNEQWMTLMQLLTDREADYLQADETAVTL